VTHPKTKKFYCRWYKKDQRHKVTQASKSEERKVALGRRRHDRKQEGFVRRVKPLLRRSKKTSKKISLRFTCQSCKRASMYCLGRLPKFDWMVAKKKRHAEPTW
jgi:large subunit ribosomal protein L44e